MVSIAVCDDEKELLTVTAAQLRCYFAGEEILLSSFDSAEALLHAVRKQNYCCQLALLDIELGAMNGIVLAEMLNRLLPDCQIIYLTGHLDYASEVYSTRHTYYVHKPTMQEHLPKALKIAMAALAETEAGHLVLPQKNGRLVLKKQEITRLERRLRVTDIYTAEGNCATTALPLDEILAQIGLSAFMRCHNSFAVNMNHVAAFRRESFLMKDGTVVPISHSYYPAVREQFCRYHNMGL